MNIKDKFQLPLPETTVIGPQLGPLFKTKGVKITIALPNTSHEKLICRLYKAHHILVQEDTSLSLHPYFKHFIFTFENLASDTRYYYVFLSEAEEQIPLEGGLTYEDCWFYTPSFTNSDKFLLVSCNNAVQIKNQKNSSFHMWAVLYEKIKNDPAIKFLIQGGDQIYNDSIEENSLENLRIEIANKEAVYQNIIRNYQLYYGNLYYRKIMAHLPSVAMLDDHDITDGWGSRPIIFSKEGAIFPEWQRYFDIAYEAFLSYQAAKNPDLRLHTGSATTYLDFGSHRLYLLDLRKEKNIYHSTAPLLSISHEASILDSLASLPSSVDHVFILSPVAAVRINPKLEEYLSLLAHYAYRFQEWVYQRKRTDLIKYSKWRSRGWHFLYKLASLGGLADLVDDLTDSLSAKPNRPFLLNLLYRLSSLSSNSNLSSFILSGDVHMGGISEIFVITDKQRVRIPQIVSSPIGSAPMNRLLKSLTTEKAEYNISLNKSSSLPLVSALNFFYRAERNFAVLTPHSAPHVLEVEFTFEDLQKPIKWKFST